MERLAILSAQVCELARQAGQKIMPFYKGRAAVTWKKDESPLTSGDTASHDFLVKALRSLSPETPVISEESGEVINGFLAADSSFWLVDPLDGTKEFVKGTNEFTVNIALVEAGRPVMGVVYAPALNLIYCGLRNSGFWRQAGDEAAT